MDPRIISRKLEILQGMATQQILPITNWEARTADHIRPGEYRFDGKWARVRLPASFPAGKTVFLRAVAPAGKTDLADANLNFAFEEMEGLLRVDGKPFAGLDANHKYVQLPRPGRLQLEVEFTSVPSVMYAPEAAGRFGIFSSASICRFDRDIRALVYDLHFAWDAEKFCRDPRRKTLLGQVVEAALLAVDLTLPPERLREEVRTARRILKQKLAAIAPDPEAGGIYAVGHTHIDVAWLWPLKETVRKCSRTFSTACRLMERYPDFYFACSQPQLYQYTKEYYPQLYAQIKQWVKRGRWETTGAMWVEADCNVTSGESLVRQMLYGLDFFRREFGTRPRTCWLPDVFGYPASLPEILKGCGVENFYTYKLHWQMSNPFTHNLFRWRGLDGSEVTANVVNHLRGYNCFFSPEQIQVGWERYHQKAEYPEVIFPFGFGDGGGGVTEDQLELLKRAQGQYPGLPAVRTGTVEAYFADIATKRPDLPVWDGELYVETHRGTYTTQSANKKANRASELLLREAEILAVFAATNGSPAKASTLRDAWNRLLVNQFHDILPGSSIAAVYEESQRDHQTIQASAKEAIATSLSKLAPAPASRDSNTRHLRLFNTLSWERNDAVTTEIADLKGQLVAISADGSEHPVQVLKRAKGRATIVFHAGAIPACGYADVAIESRVAAEADDSSTIATPTHLENEYFLLVLNADGAITRLYDKRHEREVLARGAIGNDLQLLQDGPEHEDAWNIHDTLGKRRYPFESETQVQVLERGTVRSVVRVTRTHRGSRFEQDIILYAQSDRIDFVTRVDWQERNTALKVAFPLNIRSTHATYEVQFGAYERPTHRNTTWDQQKFEVPAQRWADLSEAGYGVSLLNDCRYGYDARENVLRLTLLRSTTFPDRDADRGAHEFTYSLLPHAGNWTDGGTVRSGWELNVPIRAMSLRKQNAGLARHSFLTLNGAAVVMEALKPAEDGRGVILRVYEPHGARGRVTATLAAPFTKALPCNLVEQEEQKAIPIRRGSFAFQIQPFQIRTFRLL